MNSKSGISGDSIILGFTAWVWLLPFVCVYSGQSPDKLFGAVLTLNISSGALILAFLTLATSVLGVVGEKISFIFEKLLIGPTSQPRHWYTRRVGHVDTAHWYAAQERVWSSAQAHSEFVSARLGVHLGRTLFVNCLLALLVFVIARYSSSWLDHFNLLLSIAVIGLLFSAAAWWISTGLYLGIVRVAGDIEKKNNQPEVSSVES